MDAPNRPLMFDTATNEPMFAQVSSAYMDCVAKMLNVAFGLVNKRTSSVQQIFERALHMSPAEMPNVYQKFITESAQHYAEAVDSMMAASNETVLQITNRQRNKS